MLNHNVQKISKELALLAFQRYPSQTFSARNTFFMCCEIDPSLNFIEKINTKHILTVMYVCIEIIFRIELQDVTLSKTFQYFKKFPRAYSKF